MPSIFDGRLFKDSVLRRKSTPHLAFCDESCDCSSKANSPQTVWIFKDVEELPGSTAEQHLAPSLSSTITSLLYKIELKLNIFHNLQV